MARPRCGCHFPKSCSTTAVPSVPIHGGAIASLADFAACAAIWSLEATQRSATISMTVNYTGPGIQSDLVARATVRRA